MSNEWLKNLKVGDEVIVQSCGHSTGPERVDFVVDVAVDSVEVEGWGRRFSLIDGRFYEADAWTHTALSEPASVEIRRVKDKNRRTQLCKRLGGRSWRRAACRSKSSSASPRF